jgi:sporulation integral membrane protein YlbJ
MVSALFLLFALAALLFFSEDALESAKRGLSLCAHVIVPSLLPFFVLSALIGETGLAARFGDLCAPAMSRLFGVSGAGAAAFVLGVTGGYPLGAGIVAGLVTRGEIARDEGARLLAFCNNSGPAFILGAAGIGIFRSAGAGLLLYAAHVLAAATVGVLMAGVKGAEAPRPGIKTARAPVAAGLAEALPAAVRTSVSAVLTISGFVVTFTVFVGLLDSAGIFPRLTGELAASTFLGLHTARALLCGLLEIGSGIGSMSGLPGTPVNLAVCAFILGWGGLSVHFQTAAVIAGTGIKTARHTVGRLLCGLLSALYVLGICRLF